MEELIPGDKIKLQNDEANAAGNAAKQERNLAGSLNTEADAQMRAAKAEMTRIESMGKLGTRIQYYERQLEIGRAHV